MAAKSKVTASTSQRNRAQVARATRGPDRGALDQTSGAKARGGATAPSARAARQSPREHRHRPTTRPSRPLDNP